MAAKRTVTDAEYAELVQRCRSLPTVPPPPWTFTYGDNLVLSVLDKNLKGTIVDKGWDHFRSKHASSAHSAADLRQIVERHSHPQLDDDALAVDLWGMHFSKRAGQFRELLTYLEGKNARTNDELRSWAEDRYIRSNAQSSFARFQGKVEGLGFAVYQLLLMRLGVDTVKPDIYVKSFVVEAIRWQPDDFLIVDTLTKVADQIGLPASELDWRIFNYQKAQGKK